MRKLITLLIVLLLGPILSFGQNTVTLVASGEGPSKTEAESLALRSAIEQAFGTFVSANTTILNDDIVKDEIATISSGNIESYKIVAESENCGQWYVTVKVVVSINKLVDYAKSRGSSTEFAGQNFTMQMKMRKLNKENEEKALSDLLAEVELVSSTISFFDYSINQGEPQFVSDSEYQVPITISAKWNQNARNIAALIDRTFSSLSMSSSDQESYKSNNYPLVSCISLENITGSGIQYVLRSDFVNSTIEQLRVCFLKNLHSFYIVRKGNGEGYKTFLCPIENQKEEFFSFSLNPTLPEEVLYETEGFEVIPDPTLGVSNPQMVDLGLSVRWADMNVGASPINPYGDYYAWGEVNTKSEYSEKTYKWRDNKYGKNSRQVLELDDDVAHVKLGGKWRMPTIGEFQELLDKCTWKWTVQYGTKGYKVTSKVNGNSIFLPATGYRNGTGLYNAGRYGYYWSSIFCELNSFNAVNLYFESRKPFESNRSCYIGLSVRPVCQ